MNKLNLSESKTFYLLTLLFFLIANYSFGQISLGLPIVRNFSSIEYNAGIQNYQFAINKQGLLYSANNFGLLEYDGENWKIYGVKNGTKVRSIAIDGRGRIYTGSQGDFGFFFPNKRGELIYTSLADSLANRYHNFDETWNVFLDKDKVYFCTPSYIFIYHNNTFKVVKLAIADITFFVNNQVMVNQQGVGLGILENEEIKTIAGGSYFSNYTVSSIFRINKDEYLISTIEDGIFLLIEGKVKPWNESSQKLFKESNINCMVRLRNGQFAAGTQNKGLIKLDENGNVLLTLTREQGIESNTILSIKEDDINNLWIGQNNYITYLEMNSPFKLINEISGVEGTGYGAYQDANKLYVGSNTGLYLKQLNNQNKFIKTTDIKGQVYNIGRFTPDLLVSQHSGAFRLDNNGAKLISTGKGSWEFLPLKGDPTKLIEGTYYGLNLYILNNGHWEFHKKLTGFNESSRIMAEDDTGNIWVTHGYKGAYKIKLNNTHDSILTISFYDYKKGFPSTQLINVFEIRNELVFTSERGLFKYDTLNNKFIKEGLLTKELGSEAQIWYLQEDALGNIYYIGKGQIGVLRLQSNGEYAKETRQFNKLRKYLNDDLQNITILSNNLVLFGAKDGFVIYDAVNNIIPKSTFSALIRSVTIKHNIDSIIFYGTYFKEDSIYSRQTLNFTPFLNYDNNSIKFSFSATSYEGSNDLNYQFYLTGYDKDWSFWSNQTKIEYANLAEGNYTFHVRAKNVNGDISPETTYRFVILPPWYRSFWAFASYTIFLVSILAIIATLIQRKYDTQRKKMASIQEVKLSQKDDEIEKLALTKEQEIGKLQKEKLESEINHMNNELATATMHLLNKNEFISDIKTQLSQITKKSKNEEVNHALEQISKEIESNITGDADWEHFQFHFDRVHGDFISRLKSNFKELSPQETKLCAYLRLNLSSKEIAQLLNITVRGVEISRYRLRKKLLLERNQNLQEFILNF